MAGSNESPLIMAGSLRRTWRNAGAPSNGPVGTYFGVVEKGDLLIDITNAKLYQNTNTQASPTWTEIAQGTSGVDLETDVANMAAAGTAVANAIGDGSKASPANHVHALGAHDHSGATAGGDLGAHVSAAVTLAEGTAPAGTLCYIVRDNTGDTTINSLTGKSVNIAVAGTDVVTVAGALITLAQAVSISTGGLTVVDGGIEVTAGGITVTAGGADITGDSIITGALEVTGAFTLGTALTVNDTLTVDELILDTDGVAPAASNCYAVRDNAGDLTLNAVTGKEIHLAINGVDVLDIGTIVEIISGGLTITSGGATITGAVGVTGNTVLTGDLQVTGSFTFGGSWTVANTLTVDELILDTDGVAPAGTNAYAMSDNTGDLTVNALTGKQFIVAINGADEYTFSSTILDMLGNALDNCGFLILNAATAPAASEVYAVNDNTGDLTLNALTGKSLLVAINGVDEYTFNAASLIVAAGNTIRFAGDTGIMDSAGNEVIYVTAVGSAANYLNVRNAEAANPIILECLGTADRGFEFHNDQSEQILILTPVASAEVELTILNAAAGGQPILRVTGEADLGIEIQNLAGEVMFETFSTAAPLNWIGVSSNDTGLRAIIRACGQADMGVQIQNAASETCFATVSTSAPTVYLEVSPANTGLQPIIKVMGEEDLGFEIQNDQGEIECEFLCVATPVNWLSISNSAAGNPVILLNPGEDDIGFSFQAKNAEPILNLAATAVAKTYVVITSNITTVAPTIASAGDTADIDLSLAGKGTGYVRIDSGLDMSDNTLYGSVAADGNLVLSSTVHGTKGYVGIADGEEGMRIGGTAVRGTVGTNSLHLYVGTAPVGALNNCVSLYAAGADALTEFYAMDAAGNATNLTP